MMAKLNRNCPQWAHEVYKMSPQSHRSPMATSMPISYTV